MQGQRQPKARSAIARRARQATAIYRIPESLKKSGNGPNRSRQRENRSIEVLQVLTKHGPKHVDGLETLTLSMEKEYKHALILVKRYVDDGHFGQQITGLYELSVNGVNVAAKILRLSQEVRQIRRD